MMRELMRSLSWKRYLIPTMIVALSLVLRFRFPGSLGDCTPYVIFYPAVVFTLLLCGLRAGLYATFLCGILAAFLWTTFSDPAGVYGLFGFVASCTAICCLSEAMQCLRVRGGKAEVEAGHAAEKERADLSLKANAERLLLAHEAANAGTWEWDLRTDGNIWSRELWRLYGLEPGSCVPSYGSWLDIVHPDDRHGVDLAVREAAKNGRELNAEWRVLHPDGKERWLMSRGRPLRDAEGRVERYIGVVMDITSRKQAEVALGNQSEWLRVTLTSIGDAVISTDTECRVTFMNPAAAVLTGWMPEEVQGRAVFEVFRVVNEKTREPGEDIIRSVLREGKVLGLANHTVLVARDGHEIPIEDSAAPIQDASGKITGIVLVFHDVTEKRRMLEALERSEEHFRAIFEHAPIGAAIAGFDHRLLRANNALCRITGYSQEELVSLTILDFTHADDVEVNQETIREAARGEIDKFSFEKRYLQKSGEIIWVHVTGRVMRDQAGNPLYTISMIEDVSERKKREEELRRLNRTLRALSNTDHAMIQAARETELLNAACRIIVEDCGHPMVWIGLAEDDADRNVLPVAQAGFEEGYLETVGMTWADTDLGRGPTGTAIRTGTADVCKDILMDPRMAPWRDHAVKRGYASSVALPLPVDGCTLGALTIYSREPDSFSDDEVKLLSELADHLGYGIAAIRLREAHQQAEETLREQQEWLHVTLNSIGDAVMTTDTAGKVTFLNPVAESLTGWSLEEAFGRPVREVFRIVNHMLSEPFPHIVETVLKEGGIVALANHTALVTRDGREIPIEDSAAPIKDNEGKLSGVVLVFHDVTEKRRTQEALQENETRLLLLSEIAGRLLETEDPLGIVNDLCRKVMNYLECHVFFNFVENAKSGRLHLNAYAGISGKEAEKLAWLEDGRYICDCMAKDGACPSSENTADGSGFRMELARSHGIRAYACLPLLVRGRPIGTLVFGSRTRQTFSSEDLALMRTVTDHVATAVERIQLIEELKKSRSELELRVQRRTAELLKANEEVQRRREELAHVDRISTMGELAASLAHELGQPLAGIMSNAQAARRFLTMEEPDIKEVLAALEDIVDDNRRAGDVIKKLRSMLKRQASEKSPVSMNEVVQETLKLVANDAIRRKVTLEADLAPCLPIVEGDSVQLQQVLLNLILNAFDAVSESTAGERTVTVHTASDENLNAVKVSVCDSGPGIKPEIMGHIFESFFTTKAEGMGMGLPISKSIIETHGGRLWVLQNPGCGVTFCFFLPAACTD